MNPKSLILLEYPKVLARLKSYAAFSGSAALAESLRPTSSLEKALSLQQQTREARLLLSKHSELTFEGAQDIRLMVEQTTRGAILEAPELLTVRTTLIVSRDAKRVFLDHSSDAPTLAAMYSAALMDFPKTGVNPRRVVVPLAPDAR